MKRSKLNSRHTASGLLVVGCFVAAIACNQQTPADEQTEAALEATEAEVQDLEYDAEFAQTMAERNLLDIQLGELAQAKSASKDIKDLASKVVNEHKNANQELKAWATSKGFYLPDELSEKSQDFYDEMTEREGTDFDEAYSSYLVTYHKQSIRKLERESEKGNDAELKQWASDKIPLWQSQLDLALQTEDTAEEKNE